MIKDRAKDVLINMGMPASVIGIEYIAEIVGLFETGSHDIKIMALYEEIAKKYNTTNAGVERAIRHAFRIVVTKGNRSMVEKYLSVDNVTNSNLLHLLYYRLKQEEEHCVEPSGNDSKADLNKRDPYKDLENDMFQAIQKFIKNLREVNSDAYSKVG